MIKRTVERFEIKPEPLAADTAYGSGPNLNWLVNEKKIAPISLGRVEDGRGSLGNAATLRFPSPLIEPDVRISRIRLSDWLHREAHETNHWPQA